METVTKALRTFFGVAVRGQTYLNALYLFLAFPLGMFYFIFLVTGIALGVGLAILWVGLLLLAVVFAVWYALVVFERQMAIWLLREEIPPITRRDMRELSLWEQFKAALGNPVTWKGLVYLLAKLPLGILSFTVLVTLVSLSASLLATPLYYQWFQPEIDLGSNNLNNLLWTIDTLGEALLASLAGVLVTLVSMHVLNGLAWVSAKFARVMLGNFSAPARTTPPVEPPAPETPVLAA
jgi:hypothetical protein